LRAHQKAASLGGASHSVQERGWREQRHARADPSSGKGRRQSLGLAKIGCKTVHLPVSRDQKSWPRHARPSSACSFFNACDLAKAPNILRRAPLTAACNSLPPFLFE
jgi:hypothetical protein